MVRCSLVTALEFHKHTREKMSREAKTVTAPISRSVPDRLTVSVSLFRKAFRSCVTRGVCKALERGDAVRERQLKSPPLRVSTGNQGLATVISGTDTERRNTKREMKKKIIIEGIAADRVRS